MVLVVRLFFFLKSSASFESYIYWELVNCISLYCTCPVIVLAWERIKLNITRSASNDVHMILMAF